MLYSLRGKVIRGKQRGKDLGFSTINLRLSEKVPEGVYVSLVELEGEVYKSVSFVGAAETFAETEVLAETYIFDFDRDVYGAFVTVKLLKKIRGKDTFKFDSEEALIERVELDKKEALEYFRLDNLDKSIQ